MKVYHRVVAALVLAALAGPAVAKPPKVGQMAPNFELTLVDGGKVRLDELRGKVVLLNFWATWCAPCTRELPLLDTYYRLQEKHGLRVYAVTTEDSAPMSKMKALFKALAIPSARKIKGPFTILGAVPTSYVIDRSGRVRYAKAAELELEDLNEILVPLLREPVPAQ